MHRVVFTAKRVWWAVARYYWHAWAELGLTQARYDFMVVIEPRGERGITQADIARVLGVSRTAVSKMAKLLEELKLVRRDHLVNRRTISLRLTDDGKEAFQWARHQVRRPFFSQSLLELWLREYRNPHRAVGDVICDLEAIAYGFRAPLVEGFVYPGPYPPSLLLANDRLARENGATGITGTTADAFGPRSLGPRPPSPPPPSAPPKPLKPPRRPLAPSRCEAQRPTRTHGRRDQRPTTAPQAVSTRRARAALLAGPQRLTQPTERRA
jgi:DNA-binding MarR family transcriptional regulator